MFKNSLRLAFRASGGTRGHNCHMVRHLYSGSPTLRKHLKALLDTGSIAWCGSSRSWAASHITNRNEKSFTFLLFLNPSNMKGSAGLNTSPLGTLSRRPEQAALRSRVQ